MSWFIAFVATVGLAADPGPGNGRCRDGRPWTTSGADQVRMLGQLNRVRADAARPPLVRHDVLDRMAMAQAADMACRNYFDHKNPERDRLQDRLKRVNDGSITEWSRLAEILGTSPTPTRQVQRWIDSRSHKRALLEEDHDRVGIGLVRIANGSRYNTYWAVEFLAERRPSSAR